MVEALKKNSLAIFYTLAVLIAGAIANYFYALNSETFTVQSYLLMNALVVVVLYLPFFHLTSRADWEFREFGFLINGATFLVALLLVILSLFIALFVSGEGFLVSFVEAIARTGEELFFRGFVYALVIRVFIHQRRIHAQLWAILFSSLAFAVVHTQTLLAGNNDTMVSIFLFALFLGAVRAVTGSILPGIILHLLFNTETIIAVVLGCAIYGLFIFWAHQKGEDVFD
jgi:uncharacterized protein